MDCRDWGRRGTITLRDRGRRSARELRDWGNRGWSAGGLH